MLPRRVGAMTCLIVLLNSACQPAGPGQAPTQTPTPPLAAPTNPASGQGRTPTPSITQPARASGSAAPSPSPSPSAATTRPSPPTPSAVAAQAGESRASLLKTANTAYAGKDLARAQALYGRVISSAPSASESAAQTRAVTDFAEFRLLLTLLASGSEDRAQELLQRLRSRNADSPFTRLASDFWDQYAMTASMPGACGAIAGEVSREAGSVLGELEAMGVATSPRELCVPPGT